MSFDAPDSIRPQRIAIVGGGISGLAAAYLLAPQNNVTLFEAAPALGGHARTVRAGLNGDQPVDTGFIVFNYANYPHLTRMFQHLDVPVERSNMSFGASIDDGRVEYGLNTLQALLAQKRNLMRPGYYRMVRDILRFNARAAQADAGAEATIGDLMQDLDLGDWFQRYYLMPICGAIWSSPPSEIRDFPARSLIKFFQNHALLSASGQHQWWTVSGGSIEYLRRLTRHLVAIGAELRTNAPVRSINRIPGGVRLRAQGGETETFDQVILACHSDDALAMLADASPDEHAALGNLRYQDNKMVLHRDTTQMPRRRACWSSWVYKADSQNEQTAIGVTYWMNRLQNIPETDPLFVSLNPVKEVAPETIYDETTFRHPVFDHRAIRAQSALNAIQGQRATWFAGAYTRYGFHEDGFASAVRVARQLQPQFA